MTHASAISAASNAGALGPDGAPQNKPVRFTYNAVREDGQQAALHRVLDHYLHTYYAADLLMNTSRDPITLAPLQPGVIPESFTSLGAARTWCLDEYPALAAAVTQAARGGFSSHAWQISWAAETFVHRRTSRQDFASVQEVLHGLSSGDFVPALGQFLGSSARCRRR